MEQQSDRQGQQGAQRSGSLDQDQEVSSQRQDSESDDMDLDLVDDDMDVEDDSDMDDESTPSRSGPQDGGMQGSDGSSMGQGRS